MPVSAGFLMSILILFLVPMRAQALVGLESLETRLMNTNQEILSLKQDVEAKSSLVRASQSGFYPSLDAVGGWQQNKIDGMAEPEKGTVAYIEGRYNLFNGFKDRSNLNQKELDLKLAQIELESKTRSLRLELTEIISEMIRIHALQDILKEEYKITQHHKQLAIKKVNAGLTSSIDNLEFDLRESEVKIEQQHIDQIHKEMHQKIVRIYGEDVADAELDKIDFSSFKELSRSNYGSMSSDSGKTFSIEKNLDYQKSEINLLKAELDKTEVQSGFMPKLDFTFNIGRLTPSEETPIKLNESKYGVALVIPLFSGFDIYHKTKAARFQLASAEKSKKQKIIDLQAEYEILTYKVSELSELYRINEFKLIQSQKYSDLTNSEYKRGVKNSPDLVGATERLFSAKKRKYEILRDLELLKVKIANL